MHVTCANWSAAAWLSHGLACLSLQVLLRALVLAIAACLILRALGFGIYLVLLRAHGPDCISWKVQDGLHSVPLFTEPNTTPSHTHPQIRGYPELTKALFWVEDVWLKGRIGLYDSEG